MTITVSLNHQLIYRFDRPVVLGPHTLGLRPSPHCATPIQSYHLKLKPERHTILWQQDPYGNFLARVNFPDPVEVLEIEVDLIAQLQPINPFNFLLEQSASYYPFTYEPILAKELIPFLEISPPGHRLKTWVESHRQSQVYTPNFLVNLNQKLSQDIQYQIRLEEGIQSCEETLERREGSCRDTAFLLVQILRHLGIAARFVSGYLIQLKTDDPGGVGEPTGPVADTGDLHAWAEAYLPGAGWIGFDPTSGFLAAEGHIPLVCAADPVAASPVIGTSEPSESELKFAITLSRHQRQNPGNSPYTEEEWQTIDTLGEQVERDLKRLQVGLTMGGEPTFVSQDNFQDTQWQTAALGEEKRQIASQLLRRLEKQFAPVGSLLLYGVGKWYPGESGPRWALGCYWRTDGVALWRDPQSYGEENQNYGYTGADAWEWLQCFIQQVGIPSEMIVSGRETNSDTVVGYILPLLSVVRDQKVYWSSCHWQFSQPEREGHLTDLELLPGVAPIGLRLPLSRIAWNSVLETEARESLKAESVHPATTLSPANTIQIALTVEVRNGQLFVFIPPMASVRSFVDLITAIENARVASGRVVLLEGYSPPMNQGIQGFQITADPGVLEVNIHPAKDWSELVKINQVLDEQARLCRLGTEKYLRDGRCVSTGGGAHVTIGGEQVENSPLLRRPDLLRSVISYWQNHPSLSYIFSGLFVGPTSQAPRVDEARHESLSELEIAFQTLTPHTEVPPEVVDQLLCHLLVDVTGNQHRSAFCLDKLFPRNHRNQQLGLLELRGFAMPPHWQMRSVELLLIRALIAWFWQQPYTHPLVRWGTQLHDRFMLPYYLEQDLQGVIADLHGVGYNLQAEWFQPFIDFRCPRYGEITRQGVTLELRHALEPWLVLGESVTTAGTSRPVDDSLERIQVKLSQAFGNDANEDSQGGRYQVWCNGHPAPLRSTGVLGEYVAGVKFRARQLSQILHPAINTHSPLLFEIVDTWTQRSIGGCTYYVDPPTGGRYETFPINGREAKSRMVERFMPMGHTPGVFKTRPPLADPEFPFTLDLRRR